MWRGFSRRKRFETDPFALRPADRPSDHGSGTMSRKAVTIGLVPCAASDRAQTERHTGGMLKLLSCRRGGVLGASILGVHAGELALASLVAIEKN